MAHALVGYPYARLKFPKRSAEQKRRFDARAHVAIQALSALDAKWITDSSREDRRLVALKIESLRSATRECATQENPFPYSEAIRNIKAEFGEELGATDDYETNKQIVGAIIELLQKNVFRSAHFELYYCALCLATENWRALVDDEEEANTITREIRFPPEYHQAGIQILSYFSTVLKQKLPDVSADVSIRQSGNVVILRIAYPDGTYEEISRVLEDYGLVIQGKREIEAFLESDVDVEMLRNKLKLAMTEIQQTQKLLLAPSPSQLVDAKALKRDNQQLRLQLGNAVRSPESEQDKILHDLDMSVNIRASKEVLASLERIIQAASQNKVEALQQELETLAQTEGSVLDRMRDFIWSNSIGGSIGNAAYDLFKALWPLLPK